MYRNRLPFLFRESYIIRIIGYEICSFLSLRLEAIRQRGPCKLLKICVCIVISADTSMWPVTGILMAPRLLNTGGLLKSSSAIENKIFLARARIFWICSSYLVLTDFLPKNGGHRMPCLPFLTCHYGHFCVFQDRH